MPRVLHLCFCTLAIAVCFQTSASADILLTSGAASFNFDTDGSGDFSLTRSDLPDVLENFNFHIRTSYGNPGSEVESVFSFGSGLTIQSATATSPSSAQIVFNALVVPGSSSPSPGSDLLIPILNFGLTEAAGGHAELQFTITTIGVNFTDLGGIGGTSSLEIDTFFLFDYESDSPAFTALSNIPAYAGSTAIVGDTSGSGMVILPGDADAVEVSTSTDLLNEINAGNDFTTGSGTGDLSAGFQFSDAPTTTNFTTVHSATIVAIPEPATDFVFYTVLAAAFCFLTFDSRRARATR